MPDLTRKEAHALLVALYHELDIVLQTLKKAHVTDAEPTKKLILDKLKYLIIDGYKLDLTDKSIYDVFKSDLEI